jgi:hypothetical protein
MQKKLRAFVGSGAIALSLIATLAIGTSPAAASDDGALVTPQMLSTTSGCPAGVTTVVPDRAAVAKFGVAALIPSSQSALLDQVKDDPGLKAIAARNPTWLTSIQCEELPATANTQFLNWSGYQSEIPQYPANRPVKNYHSVYMSWIAQPANTMPTSTAQWTSVWPGIGSGRVSTDTLVQAGTNSNSGPGFLGIGNYAGVQAWFEAYPRDNMEVIPNFSVNTGDRMNVSVLQGGTYANYIICNATQNTCVYPSENLLGSGYSVSGPQAEYIVERPTLNDTPGGEYTELQPFSVIDIQDATGQAELTAGGYVNFTEGDGSQADPVFQAIDMIGCNGTHLANTGTISGGSFPVTFASTGVREVPSC